MPENLIMNIRRVENGFVATFTDMREPGVVGDEYVAMAPADLRTTVAAEVESRLTQMIDRLHEMEG